MGDFTDMVGIGHIMVHHQSRNGCSPPSHMVLGSAFFAVVSDVSIVIGILSQLVGVL